MMKRVLDELRRESRRKMWQKFDFEGFVSKGFVPPVQAVNANLYCEVLRRLRSKYPP